MDLNTQADVIGVLSFCLYCFMATARSSLSLFHIVHLCTQVSDWLSRIVDHREKGSMNSRGPAPGDSALWNTAPESGTPAWPPYKLPSDYLPSSSTSLQQAYYIQGTVHPARQGFHGPVPLMPEQSTPQHGAPMSSGAPPSSGAPCSAMQGALTTVPRHSVPITYHAPYSVNNQPHGGLPLESYFTAHLQYPKTWVHLWDRLPLREPETLISSVRSRGRWLYRSKFHYLLLPPALRLFDGLANACCVCSRC